MIAHLTQWILDAIRAHGAASVFMGVMIEQIIIPIPSPAIIMGGGFILVPGAASWGEALLHITWKIVLPGAVASTLGSVLLHLLAAWGGKAFVDRFQGWIGFAWKDVEAFSRRLSASGAAATLFFMRALPIMPLSLISIAAGAVRLPLGPYTLWTFLGSIPRCYILALLGWQMGARALDLARGVNRVESVASLAVAAGIVGVVLYLRRRVRGAAL